MELTAEELKIIQDRRANEAKKAEEAAKAARSIDEKAHEIFQKRASANNALALDLVVELKERYKGENYSAVKVNATEYTARIDGKRIKASDVNFVNHGGRKVIVSDTFGNSVEIKFNAEGVDDKGNLFHMSEIYQIEARNYYGATAKNAIRICVNRLEQLRAKQIELERKELKLANAKAYIQAWLPKATKVQTYFHESYCKFSAEAFEDAYQYTSVKGTVFFNEDLTVKSKTYQFDSVYGKGTEKDNILKAIEEEKAAAISAITKEFNKKMIAALNA